MSTIVRKLIGQNLQNILVIALAFGVYFIATYFQLPVLIQLVAVSAVLLTLLQVRGEIER